MNESTDEPAAPAAARGPKKYYAKDFEWGDPLGQGAFGAVQKVKHIESNEYFACKILIKAQIAKEKKVKYVKTERDILAMCSSPFIVSLFCTFSDPDHLYYVLELCPNGELYGLLKKHQSFDLNLCRIYTAEIALALEHLHSKNIIHRDLKPENVLLSSTMHAKLTDFGTSKQLDSEPSSSSTSESSESSNTSDASNGPKGIARSQSFVGTAEYVSPELLIDKYCCLASDLWALGAILFQMITGKMAFHGATQFLTFQKVQKGEVEWPVNMQEFDSNAKDLIEKLLILDPTQRIGATSYQQLKSHPFFEGLDWDNLHKSPPPEVKSGTKMRFKEDEEREKEEARKKREAEYTEQWKKHLNAGEVVLEHGLIIKKRGMSSKKRQLILTNTPRLLYVNVSKDITMGQIPWTDDLTLEVKSAKEFVITTGARKWLLTTCDRTAAEWETAIKSQLKK